MRRKKRKMKNINYKIRGSVSIAVIALGAMTGLGLIALVWFGDNSGLGFENKDNLLAAVSSTICTDTEAVEIIAKQVT